MPRSKRRKLPLKDRLIAYLPRYAPYARRLAPLMNLRDRIPGAATLSRAAVRPVGQTPAAALADGIRSGSTASSALPLGARSRSSPTPSTPTSSPTTCGLPSMCWWRLAIASDKCSPTGGRRVCCGRTFLAAGLVDEARAEAQPLSRCRPATGRARRADHRPRTVVPADAEGRVPGDDAGR